MKSGYLKSKIGGALLAFSILFGIGIASSTTAQAQFGYDPYGQNRAQEREQRRRQREYEREQRRRQREARRNNRGYDPYGTYDPYRNNGGYYGGGSAQMRQTALNAGYNEGIKEGRNDRNRGERYEFRDESDYREATRDYNSRFGDRELYRRYFRQGFENGYGDGYRGY
jgi:hypothetical protein